MRIWTGLKRLKKIYAVVSSNCGQYDEWSKSVIGMTLSASEEFWSMAAGLENSSKLSTWLLLFNLCPNQRNVLKLVSSLCFTLIVLLAYEIWGHTVCWLSGRGGETRNAYRCLWRKRAVNVARYVRKAGSEARSAALVFATWVWRRISHFSPSIYK